MFNYFKSTKEILIVAPCDGNVILLDQVNDVVFSDKLMGDGLAIEPLSDFFTSPVHGKVTQVFNVSHHAYIIEAARKVQVLIHIGLNTVELQGQGFKPLTKAGRRINQKDLLAEVDLQAITDSGRSTVTPIIIIKESLLLTKPQFIVWKTGKVNRGEVIAKLIFDH